MTTIYLTRSFEPILVNAVQPGDVHADPEQGDCRRLTAKRFCLASERLGKGSDAFLGLLGALGGAAENGAYDGRAIKAWYGLVGLSPPPRAVPELAPYGCRRCKRPGLRLREALDGLCFFCWWGTRP